MMGKRYYQTINRKSALTGNFNTMRLKIDPADVIKWKNGMLLQDAFPYLTASEREFIKTGITPEEWKEEFGQMNSEEE